MDKPAAKSQEKGTIFQNRFLEALTHFPPVGSAVIYAGIGLGILGYGIYSGVFDAAWKYAALYGFAIFFWTFFEYFFHRYVNHLDVYIPNSPAAAKFAHTVHGIHHDYPRDKERLIMPPVPGIIILSIVFGAFYLVLGKFAFVFMPGFLNGYLVYTYIHYTVHQTKIPGPLKGLYKHHAVHHYKSQEQAFGVSTQLWDKVFGTMPNTAAEKKE